MGSNFAGVITDVLLELPRLNVMRFVLLFRTQALISKNLKPLFIFTTIPYQNSVTFVLSKLRSAVP